MITPITTRSPVAGSLALAAVSLFGMSACDDGDGSEPDTTLVDEPHSDSDVPFDPNVSPGVPETDEQGNLGFDVDDGGSVGDQTSPND